MKTIRDQYRTSAKSAHDAIHQILEAKDIHLLAALKNKEKSAKAIDNFTAFLKIYSKLNPWELSQKILLETQRHKTQAECAKTYFSFCKEYRSHIRKFPSMIRVNGLVAAWAFMQKKKKEGDAWTCLEDQLEKHLIKYIKSWVIGETEVLDKVQNFLLNCSRSEYRQISKETINYCVFLGEYAVGKLVVETKKETQKSSKT